MRPEGERPRLTFLLDEGVPVSAGRRLEAAGHTVHFFGASGLQKGSPDALVCATAVDAGAILVAQDGDMKVLARGHGVSRARFPSLSLLQLKCRESESANRLEAAMSLLEHEWQRGAGRERRLFIELRDSSILTYR